MTTGVIQRGPIDTPDMFESLQNKDEKDAFYAEAGRAFKAALQAQQTGTEPMFHFWVSVFRD